MGDRLQEIRKALQRPPVVDCVETGDRPISVTWRVAPDVTPENFAWLFAEVEALRALLGEVLDDKALERIPLLELRLRIRAALGGGSDG